MNTTKIIGRLTITANLFKDITAEVRPLYYEDGSIDQAALADYEEFIVNALEIFDAHDFQVIEEAESDRSHSIYFSLVKKDDYANKEYKYVLFIRISDHALSERSKSARHKYYADKASELKQPIDKRKQLWKLKDIIVNDSVFSSYDEALDDIDRRLDNI